ncbi:MAG: hypothetical protein RIT04_441 [Candidatus Parcubacteria bacterium]|jgi:hypothetical protein
MNQKRIKDLLIEASQPNCTHQRRNQIHVELSKATVGSRETDTPAAGVCVVLDILYVDTIKHHPERLPSLFPAFAVMCGDRPDSDLVADIDWQHA